MKRFLISSTAFNGDAEIIFDQAGRLIRFDVMNTDMPPVIVKIFKEKLPVIIDDLATSFKENVTIVEAAIDYTPEDFLREYPYKRNTHLIAPIWLKMDQTDHVLAYYAAIEYRKYCDRNKHWYNPKIAAAWLKNREYLNDWKKM
jgi:hypothetical protein